MKQVLFTVLTLCIAVTSSAQWLEGGRKQELPTSGNGAILYHEGKLYTFNETMFMSRSDDNGATWIDLPDSGLPPKGPGIAKGVARLTAAGGRIYGGMNFGNGTGMPVYSTDLGETWHQDTLGAPGHALGWDGLPAVGDIFAWGHWLYVKWDAPNAFDIKEFGGPFIRNTYMATNGNQPSGRCAKGDTLFTSSVKFKYTIDGGANWVIPASNGITHDNYFTGGGLYTDGNRIYMIARKIWNGPFSIFYTDDNGENWTTIDVPTISTRKDFSGLYYSPISAFFKGNNIWMAFTIDSLNSPPNIFRSTDLGLTWSKDVEGLPKSYFNGANGFAYSDDGTLWLSPSYQEIYKQKITDGAGGGNSITTPAALVEPHDQAYIISGHVTFLWNSTKNAETYHLQVALDSALTSFSVDKNDITDTSYAFESLANGKKYYWRVRGMNDEGYGPWSVVRTFSTVAESVSLDAAEMFTITPNPATDVVHIKTNTTQNMNVIIRSLVGVQLLESTTAGNIDIQKLPAGMYYLTVTTHGISRTHKLIKR